MNRGILKFSKYFTTITIAVLILANSQIRGILADGKPGIVKIAGTSSSSSEIEYNITQCNPELSNVINGTIYKITHNGNCINIYHEKNCQGHFVRYISSSYETLTSPDSHRWKEEDDALVTEPLVVHSIGPCLDRCDPRNWEGAGETTSRVTLYQEIDFEGNETRVDLDSDDCHLLPAGFWKSLKISGDEFNSCVELHSEPSCGGEFTQFRPGYLELYHLYYWGLGGGHSAVLAKAVSRCGSVCNKVIPPVKAAPLENPGPGIVTYYDSYGYYGNAVNINLTGGVCVTPSLSEFHWILSIRTYGQCVILYGLPDCEERREGYSTLQTAGMEKDYYVEKLLTLRSPAFIKSLRLCPKNTDEVVAERPPTSENEAVVGCNVTNDTPVSGTEAGLPIWMLFLVSFCGMLILVVGALLGSFITKRYESSVRGANSERFNVLYKLES